MSAAIVRDGGDYGAVIVSGSNLRHEPVAVAEQWKAVGGAKVLILQNEIPEPANLAAAGAANADGAFVIMSAAPAKAPSKVRQSQFSTPDHTPYSEVKVSAKFKLNL